MSPIRTNNFTLTRRLYIGFVVLCGLILLVTYITFQARFLIEGPHIELTLEPDILQHERFITLTGAAKNITALTLNGRPIQIDEEGVFAEHILIENGHTVVRLEAKDRYGRTAYVEREFVYVHNTLSLAP